MQRYERPDGNEKKRETLQVFGLITVRLDSIGLSSDCRLAGCFLVPS
jgi:hypothetical protein